MHIHIIDRNTILRSWMRSRLDMLGFRGGHSTHNRTGSENVILTSHWMRHTHTQTRGGVRKYRKHRTVAVLARLHCAVSFLVVELVFFVARSCHGLRRRRRRRNMEGGRKMKSRGMAKLSGRSPGSRTTHRRRGAGSSSAWRRTIAGHERASTWHNRTHTYVRLATWTITQFLFPVWESQGTE